MIQTSQGSDGNTRRYDMARFIITASYDHNGTACDTSNHESLGAWYGHEFATEDDASQAADELTEAPSISDHSVTYTVECIGITEDEVASKSGDEWWDAVVGQQTPVEFMDGVSDAREAALEYLASSPVAGAFHNEDAKSDLATKLAEVIEAQLGQWLSLKADAERLGMVTEDSVIVFEDDCGIATGWLERDGADVDICEGGERRTLDASQRTIAAALPDLHLSGPTTAELKALRSAAARDGDWLRVARCTSALAGEVWALADCAAIITAAKA